MILIGGMGTTGAGTVVFIYMCEFLTERQVVIASTISYSFSATVFGIITFYFDIIHYDYRYLIAFGMLMSFVCLVGLVFIVESPIWLLKAGKTEEGQKALVMISKFNGVDCG